MVSTIGVNLRVTGHCNQGGRKYMEDAFVVAYQQTENERDLEYAYFGIFDGHGGREAALYAKDNLMDQIVSQKNFWSDDDDLVLKAIRDGFLTTHMAMWKEVGNWPKTVSGLPSTSGTTSSIAFIRQGKMYIGHVGDSKIVLGYQEPGSGAWLPLSLTKDHKPESPKEKKRIYSVGGLVMNKAGVERVVWNRPRIGHKGPIRRSTMFDQIPFLAVARSLGDLWSYNYLRREFVVSPEPDTTVFTLDPKRDRCIILASDGLWNMVSTRDAVTVVQTAEEENEQLILEGGGANSVGKPSNNPSKLLVDKALRHWYLLRMRADNTSVVTVFLDPPGPPKSEVLLRQKIMQKLRPRDDQAEGETPLPNSNDAETLELKAPPKKISVDNSCAKPAEEVTLPKEKKKDANIGEWIHKLPKPVVLSPQRVFVKHRISLSKPHPSSNQNEDNPPKVEENQTNDSPLEPIPATGGVSSKTEVNGDSPKEQRKVLCPDSKQNIEAATSPENRQMIYPSHVKALDSSIQPTIDMFVKENGFNNSSGGSSTSSSNSNNNNCQSASSPTCTDPSKESGRTHLSEVDNIVNASADLDNRVNEHSRTLSHSPELKPMVSNDSGIVHDVETPPPLTLKRKSSDLEDDSSTPAKNLRISRSSWLRDCSSSTFSPSTRSQLRIRKVKVR